MSLTFKHTIVHVLDKEMDMPLLSTGLLILNNEIEDFITRHLIKIFESSASSEAQFNSSASLPHQLESPFTTDSFITLSNELAQTFYHYMKEYQTIPSGDLVLTSFIKDEQDYFALLKLNYKEEYTHFVEQSNGNIVTQIIKNKGIFPGGSKQVEEGLIINRETLKVTILDTSKEKYLKHLFDLEPALSIKETLKTIEHVTNKVIETHYTEPIRAINALKDNITESIARTQTIPVEKIMKQTFGDDEEVFTSCMEHIESFGLKDATLEIRDTKIGNKFASQKLKTDTGIEIKLPTHLFKDPDFIEIINEPNGTISVVIKNISQIINK